MPTPRSRKAAAKLIACHGKTPKYIIRPQPAAVLITVLNNPKQTTNGLDNSHEDKLKLEKKLNRVIF